MLLGVLGEELGGLGLAVAVFVCGAQCLGLWGVQGEGSRPQDSKLSKCSAVFCPVRCFGWRPRQLENIHWDHRAERTCSFRSGLTVREAEKKNISNPDTSPEGLSYAFLDALECLPVFCPITLNPKSSLGFRVTFICFAVRPGGPRNSRGCLGFRCFVHLSTTMELEAEPESTKFIYIYICTYIK